MFRQNVAFPASTIVALALRIGSNSAIFSLVNAVLLKPLHVRESDRVVRVPLSYQGRATSAGSPQIVSFWRQHGDVLQDVADSRLELMNLTGAAALQQLTVGRVNAEFFHLFDAPVSLGRAFAFEEDLPKSGHVALLSHALWSRSFGADAHILGKSILLCRNLVCRRWSTRSNVRHRRVRSTPGSVDSVSTRSGEHGWRLLLSGYGSAPARG
jgi:hypothetical protein